MVKEIPSDSGEKPGSEPTKALDLARTYSLGKEFQRKLDVTSFPMEMRQKIIEETFSSIDDIDIKEAKKDIQDIVKTIDVYKKLKSFNAFLKDFTQKIRHSRNSYNQVEVDQIQSEIREYIKSIYNDSQSFEKVDLIKVKEWSEKLISGKKDFVEKTLDKAIDHLYNFTTLTNLKESDWQCLGERKSTNPLYIVVHTTNSEVRKMMLNDSEAGGIINSIKRLGDMRMSCHAQLMLCPTINDGEHLNRSIEELAKLRPMVKSIVVAPPWPNISLLQIRRYTEEEAKAIVDQAEKHQRTFAESDPEGNSFVYLLDQWYFLAKRDFPPAKHYGTYDHIEQGIGKARFDLDELAGALEDLAPSIHEPRRVTFVTGGMAQPIIDMFAQGVHKKVELLDVQVMPIGAEDTVAGLLGGKKVLASLQASKENETIGDLVLLPRVMLDNKGMSFLDKVTVEDFKAELSPVRVEFVSGPQGIVDAIRSLADMENKTERK